MEERVKLLRSRLSMNGTTVPFPNFKTSKQIGKDIIFVAFVEDSATMSSIRYFENHVSYFVQNRRK